MAVAHFSCDSSNQQTHIHLVVLAVHPEFVVAVALQIKKYIEVARSIDIVTHGTSTMIAIER